MRNARLIMAVMVFGLSACGEPSLRELLPPGDGPDEFSIVPTRPLQQPESYSALPQPTPGGANRTDQAPERDAIAALGGQATSPVAPVPGADAAIVNYASRSGRDPGIRAKLAQEDEAFRKRQARFAQIRIVPEDRYDEAYRRQALDAYATAEAFRRAGVPVPSAPPRRGR